MAEKMLVTQALDERDLLKKKIKDKIKKAKFVDAIRVNEEKTMDNRLTKTEFNKEAKAAYQQILDLINRYQQIDAAIVASNASTFIETSYGRFSVAGAISLRNRLRESNKIDNKDNFEGILREKLEKDYDFYAYMIEEENGQLRTTAEGMRLSILGKESKTKDEKPLKVVDEYIKENTTEMVDPIDVQKKIEELKVKSDTLLTELDTQIKVSNATTFIAI